MFGKKFFHAVTLCGTTVGLVGSATVCSAPPPELVPQLASEQLRGIVDFFELSRDEAVDMLQEVNNKLSQCDIFNFKKSESNLGKAFSYIKRRVSPKRLYVDVLVNREVSDEDPRYLEFFRKDRGYYRANFVNLDRADLSTIRFRK